MDAIFQLAYIRLVELAEVQQFHSGYFSAKICRQGGHVFVAEASVDRPGP